MVRVTLRPAHHSLCLLVAYYRLLFLVPFELSAENIRKVAQYAQVGDADGRFYIHNRLFAGLDSLEPVLFMAGTLIDVFTAGRQFPLASFFLGPCSAIAAAICAQ